MSDAQTYQTLQLSHDLPGKNATNQQQHHKSKVTLKIRPQNETAASNCKQQIFDGLEWLNSWLKGYNLAESYTNTNSADSGYREIHMV